MPKIKTKRAAAKRLKATGTGKLKRSRGWKRHKLEGKGPKRIILVMMRDADAEQFVESIEAGMRANNTEAQIAAVKTQIDELKAMIRAVGQSKKGARIVLDYALSDHGTTLFVDGVAQGRPMAGKAFYQVLLRIWLGEDPVQPDLKEALLGN